MACDNFQTSLGDEAVTEKVTAAGLPLFKRFPRHSLGRAASSGLVKLRLAKPAQGGEEVRVARGFDVVELVEVDFAIEGEEGEFKRERTRGGGSWGAHRTGMGRACGAMRACVEKGRKRRLAALSKEAVAKVMAKATENMSCSLMCGAGLGEQDVA